jgi:hypothetical protein
MRIYFDENFSPALVEGLRRIQEGRRRDDIEVCSVKEEFGRGARDEDWIPGIASRHGVVITQDTNIHRTKAQWELCRRNKIGVFFVKPPKKGWGYWDIVQLTFRWWPQICVLSREGKRPFSFLIEQTGSRIKPLDAGTF